MKEKNGRLKLKTNTSIRLIKRREMTIKPSLFLYYVEFSRRKNFIRYPVTPSDSSPCS